eukprot:Transcript_14172.p2 GENE.Transcript_14172~~Transcript_14172.p2  ORF type:complete len:153 (-),score=56.85 Transcript_14172:96-554(-)
MRACVQSHQLEPLGACRARGPGPRLHADTLLRRRTPGKLGGPPAPSCELAAARYKGQPEDKLKLIFNTYDEDGSGAIDMAEMRKMLTCTLTIEDPAEKEKMIEEIIEKAMNEIDIDGSETITFEELTSAFRHRPHLISEYFGQNIAGCEELY